MTFELQGTTVLVTGASSGIGAGLAKGFADAGATVGIVARREALLAETLEYCQAKSPGSAMWVCDLSDLDRVDQLAEEVLGTFGTLDVLVNNAGIPKRRHVTKLDAATVELVMAINYFSPIRLTLRLLPHMLERGSGHIVNVSSVAAPLSSPGEAAYDASKAAITAFSECMAIDLWDTGIKMLIVYPGVIDTPLFQLPDNEPSLAGIDAISVEDAVPLILDALRNEEIQLYIPSWFTDIVATKVADLAGFLEGSAIYVKQQRSAAGLDT